MAAGYQTDRGDMEVATRNFEKAERAA